MMGHIRNAMNDYIVLSHTSALWYHRLAAAGILSPANSSGGFEPAGASAGSRAISQSGVDKYFTSVSTADLAARDIYVKAEVEGLIREFRPKDPMEVLAYVADHPHTIELPRPLELLVGEADRRVSRDGVVSHLMTGPCPAGAIMRTSDRLGVASPELVVFQLAPVLEDVHLVAALIMELAGKYALLPPGLISVARYLRDGKAPFDKGRLLGDGYVDAVPMSAVENIAAHLEETPHLAGAKVVRRALSICGNGSESPFETAVDVSLQLPQCHGGAGVGKGKVNESIVFSDVERKIAIAGWARADLLFTAKDGRRIDIEPGGAFGHATKRGMDRDRRRRHALEHAKIEVIDVTWDEFSHEETWDALCRRINYHLGKSPRKRSAKAMAKWRRVHDDFCSFDCLRVFPPSEWRR